MAENEDIASYEVSEDGLIWRPYDPVRDRHQGLHKRIVFAAPSKNETASPAEAPPTARLA